VDAAGKLWVTDFGLARIGTEAGPTLTGDLVGTLRYMSPEQALAQRVPIDHRTDIYSLGATLYELLTLRPAVAGSDRQELLQQIAFAEPVRPRLERAIPTELETVVLKALEKNPADRYATAGELADDLRRFLNDEPVRARRPSLVQRARKWGRRHRAVVVATGVVLALALVLLGGAAGWLLQRRAAAEAEAQRALAEAEDYTRQARFPEARAAAQRAEGLLTGGGGRPSLRLRVSTLLADLAMVERLEEIRLEQSHVKDDGFDGPGAHAAYAKAFRDYGLDVAAAEKAGDWIRARSIAVVLAAALDDWAVVRWEDVGMRKRLLAIARVADPDPLRTQVRQALAADDRGQLLALANRIAGADFPASTLVSVGRVLQKSGGGRAQTVTLLREAQRRYPGDFWVNHELAFVLKEGESHLT
jgi:hypothetical protein